MSGKRNNDARKVAVVAGLKRYFTGLPCRNGHIAERHTDNGSCVDCVAMRKAEADRKYYIKNANKMRARAQKWREENIERARENDRKKWFAKHEENLAKCRARQQANSQEYSNRKKEKYIANIDNERGKMRDRYKRNPEAWKVNARNRKARVKRSEGTHTPNDIRRIFEAQRGLCAWCRASVADGYHVDHIRPISRGGSNWPSNLQILCEPCNLRKGAHDPIKFAAMEGRLL